MTLFSFFILLLFCLINILLYFGFADAIDRAVVMLRPPPWPHSVVALPEKWEWRTYSRVCTL